MLAIVVDSSACLTRAEAARIGAVMVPMTYKLDGVLMQETFMGENGDFAAALDENRITEGAGTSVETFLEAFEHLSQDGSDILCITTSGKFSSCHRNACKAADQVRGTIRRAAGATSREANSAAAAGAAKLPRISVLDSQSAICGVEALANLARELDGQGLSYDEIVARLEQARADQGIAFSVPSTAALRRTGRLAQIPLSVGKLLNRYPVLTVREGSVKHVDTARGIQALARQMAACVPDDAPRDITLTYFGRQGASCTELLRAVKSRFPLVNVRVKQGGPVLSSILGQGAVSLAWGRALA